MSAEKYAEWIVQNQDKQGTPEFETVAEAYRTVRAQGSQPSERPSPTAGERSRAFTGGVSRNIAGLLGLPMDTVQNVANLGLAGVGTVATALGKPDLAPNLIPPVPLSSDWFSRVMESAGVNTKNPRQDDTASRMLYTGGQVVGGSLLPVKGQTPSNFIRTTTPSAITGAVAGEVLGPEWVGVGSMLPNVARQGFTNVKDAVAARTAPRLETFKEAGTMPSVGQATDSSFLHGLENLAAKFPGGSGIMKNFIDTQQKNIGMKSRTGVSAEDAGRAIESGVRGESGFLNRTRTIWQGLDDAVAQKIPQTARFAPTNTVQALDDLTRPVQGAEQTTAALVHPKIAGMRETINADLAANNGAMPFESLRALRTRVGSMIDDSLVSGVPNGELKRVYSSLSKDLEAAANSAGAGQEFTRQNNYYRARMSRIENVLDRVIGKGSQPEDIFKRINPTDPDQANKLRAVMRSLEPAERQVVSEAVANRLGRARPGKQDVLGETFSSETFLTNWNKLSPGAKAQLFPDKPLRDNMEKIAQAAGVIREGKGIYSNPSGTAGSFAAYSVYASPIASIATGSIAPLAAAGGAAGTAYIGAKMLTSPKVVEWLAKPVNPNRPNEAGMHLARLSAIYNQTSDEGLKEELDKFIQSTNKQKQPPSE